MDPEALIRAERVVLDRIRVGSTIAVSREATITIDSDQMADMLRVRLESTVLADKLVGDTKVITGALDFPASPWQFFKAAHADSRWLGWLVRRRPVRTKPHPYSQSVTFERYATYPRHRLTLPALGTPVVFEMFK